MSLEHRREPSPYAMYRAYVRGGAPGAWTASALLSSLTLALLLVAPSQARAANILFVSDFSSDTAIIPALTADGHTVTMTVNDYSFGNNERLRESLEGIDVVYWSATGGQHTDAAVFLNLTAFVTNGGRVFVTGFDSLTSSPADSLLIAFLGGTGARDTFNSPGPLASIESTLTVGVVDVRGVRPTGSVDNDCLDGLGSDTLVIADNGGDPSCGQWTIRTMGAGEAAYVSNSAAGAWTDTSAGGAGAFNAAVRNFALAGDSGSTMPGAPEITVLAMGSTSEGSSFEVHATVTDPESDAFTFSWDLDADGVFGERPGEAIYTVPADTTDGPEGLVFSIEAVDDAGHRATRTRVIRVTNVAPEVVSEAPTIASILADLEYQIVARDPAGEGDPLTFELAAGPDGMSVNATGLVSWVPTEADLTEPDERLQVDVRIADGDGGETAHTFELEVSRNRRPSAPTPTYPIDLLATLERTPRLATQNSEDLDLDPLTYVFELDTVETFDSAERRASPQMAEMPGFTEWRIEEPLAVDRLYHWRVRSNDGIVHSVWRGSSFYVVSDPDLMEDAGVSDGGGLRADGGLIPGVDAGISGGGGGCAVRPAGAGAPGFFVLVLVFGALAARRRVSAPRS